MIQAVTTRNLRKNFKKYADDVANYGDTLLVARPENKNVVVISEKEYNSWQETNYLLGNEANREALAKSIAQLSSKDQQKLLTPEEFEELSADD